MGVRVDVDEELKVLGKLKVGVWGDVGYGGCETRIEGIVQCT